MDLLRLERNFDVLSYLKKLGLSYKDSPPNVYLTCPVCDKKDKLWVLIKDKKTSAGVIRAGAWICYKCTEGGRSPISLIQRLEDCTRAKAIQVLREGANAKRTTPLRKAVEAVLGPLSRSFEDMSVLSSEDHNSGQGRGDSDDLWVRIDLPEEYSRDFSSSRARRGADAYGLTDRQIEKHRIGWCSSGYYRKRLIVPVRSPEVDETVSFVARWMSRDVPEGVKKVVYPKKKSAEPVLSKCLFNYEVAKRQRVIVLVEDVFSAIRVGKCAVATFGTNLSRYQKELLLQSSAEEIVLMWDRDATVRHKSRPCGLVRDRKTGRKRPCPHCARYDKTQKLLLWLSEFWRVKLVILPDKRDPKDWPRKECWRMIRETLSHDARSALRASVEARLRL